VKCCAYCLIINLEKPGLSKRTRFPSQFICPHQFRRSPPDSVCDLVRFRFRAPVPFSDRRRISACRSLLCPDPILCLRVLFRLVLFRHDSACFHPPFVSTILCSPSSFIICGSCDAACRYVCTVRGTRALTSPYSAGHRRDRLL